MNYYTKRMLRENAVVEWNNTAWAIEKEYPDIPKRYKYPDGAGYRAIENATWKMRFVYNLRKRKAVEHKDVL